MRNRRRHRTHPVDQLRLAIDCLPVATREAMLEGVRASERIIAGAYVDGRGGVCPMLAAHRRGGRTDFLSFAKSWDRFTRAARMRPATEREIAILTSQLEDSLLKNDGLQLDQAISEHRKLRSRRLRGVIACRARSEPSRRPGDNPAAQTDRRAASPVSLRG